MHPPTPAATTDLYATLGVATTASGDDITNAFRARAKELHPDLHPGDVVIAERFKHLTSAYRVLSRPTSRAAYDARRAARKAPVRPGPRASGGGPPTTAHDPLFRTAGRARAAMWFGIALVVAGLATSGVLLSVPTGDSAKTITLWLVAAKFVVCGGLLWGAGAWRLHTFRTRAFATRQ